MKNERDTWITRWLWASDYTPPQKGDIHQIEFLCANTNPDYAADFVSTIKQHMHLQQRFRNDPQIVIYRRFYPPETYSCLALVLTPKAEAMVLREASKIGLNVDEITSVPREFVADVRSRNVKGLI